jgi:hypothetical protein
MAQNDINPYRPTPASGSSAESFPSRGSLSISLFSAIYTLAFLALIIFLFRSPTGDSKSALMLLSNTPFLIALVIAARRCTRMAMYFALAAVFVQAAIAIGMTALNVGDQRRIAEVNFVLALPLLIVAAWSWRSIKPSSA